MSHNAKDLTGLRFGRLIVVRLDHCNNGRVWFCKCDCEQTKVVRGAELANGHVRSCGCLKRERTLEGKPTHRMSGTIEYSTWMHIRRRCSNPNAPGFENYGGRGISVCERWFVFENFFDDMGLRPTGTSIDRINNDGNYEPGNCRWATREQQNQNSRHVRVTPAQVVEIRRLYSSGLSGISLSQSFRVSLTTIRDIANRRTWRNL